MAVCGRCSEDIYGVYGCEYVKLEERGMLGWRGGVYRTELIWPDRVTADVIGSTDISDITGCEWEQSPRIHTI